MVFPLYPYAWLYRSCSLTSPFVEDRKEREKWEVKAWEQGYHSCTVYILCSSLEIAVTDGREDQNFHRHSKSFSWSPVCSCCGSSFNTVCDVMFSNKCAQCKNLTCRMCMKKVKKRRFCTVCYKERYTTRLR